MQTCGARPCPCGLNETNPPIAPSRISHGPTPSGSARVATARRVLSNARAHAHHLPVRACSTRAQRGRIWLHLARSPFGQAGLVARAFVCSPVGGRRAAPPLLLYCSSTAPAAPPARAPPPSPLGPPRPSSALLGSPRLSSAPISSSRLPSPRRRPSRCRHCATVA